MSLVRVTWTETSEYTKEIEVPGFDLEHGEPNDLIIAIGALSAEEVEAGRDHDSLEIDISGHEIIREGDEEEDVRGCSCGMADYGAPGHDGHDEEEGDDDGHQPEGP
jgi:hypothetical protein